MIIYTGNIWNPLFQASTFAKSTIGKSSKKSTIMKSMNKTQLIGYLGKDPVIKEFQTGNVMASLRLATQTKKKNTTEGTADAYHTTWHNVTVWGRDRVEKIINHFIKGSHVLVEGRLEYSSYIDKSGNKRFSTEIKADSVMNLDR